MSINQGKPIDLLYLGTFDYYMADVKFGGIQVSGGLVLNDVRDNIRIGVDAVLSATTGTFNIGFGANALKLLTVGRNNTALGQLAMANAGGALCNNNLAAGYMALSSAYDSQRCVVLGTSAARNVDNAVDMVVVGTEALGDAAIGRGYTETSSIIMGNKSGYKNGGSYNVVMGHESGYELRSGSTYNVLIGYQSGRALGSGTTNNVVMGSRCCTWDNTAGYTLTATDSVAIGRDCVRRTGANTDKAVNISSTTIVGNECASCPARVAQHPATVSNCVFIGRQCGQFNITNDSIVSNVCVGNACTFTSAADDVSNNVLVGTQCSVGGNYNVAIGSSASVLQDSSVAIGYNTKAGTNSVSIGKSVLEMCSATDSCVAIGQGVLNKAAGATSVIAIGKEAIGVDTLTSYTGDSVIAIGYQCGYKGPSPYNTLMGYQCGLNLTPQSTGDNGKYNTMIGYMSGISLQTTTQQSVIIGSRCCMNNSAPTNYATATQSVAIGDSCLYRNGGATDKSISLNDAVVIGNECAMCALRSTAATVDASVFIGRQAGTFQPTTTSVKSNVCIGNMCTFLATTATVDNCVMVGYNCRSTGSSTVAIGSQARAFGTYAIAIGTLALAGGNSVSLGTAALTNGSSPLNCVAIGYHAMYNAHNPSSCIAIGTEALALATASSATYNGQYVIAIGYQAAYNGPSYYNTAIGFQSGFNLTYIDTAPHGRYNTMIGYRSGKNLGTVTRESVVIGSLSCFDVTESHLMIATSSVAIGHQCVYRGGANDKAVNIADTVAIGSSCLASPDRSSGVEANVGQTVAIGYNAGYFPVGVTSQFANTFVGYECKLSDSFVESDASGIVLVGARQTAIGDNCVGIGVDNGCRANTVAIGYQACMNFAGENNVAIGVSALAAATATSTNNVVVGFEAAKAATDATSSVIIGDSAGKATATATSAVLIGKSAAETTANTASSVIIGDSAGVNTNTATTSVLIGFQTGTDNTAVNLVNDDICIGTNARVRSPLVGGGNIVVGVEAVGGNFCIAIGYRAKTYNAGIASINGSIAIGDNALVDNEYGIAIGHNAASTTRSIAFGTDTKANSVNCVVIGDGATIAAGLPNTLRIGAQNYFVRAYLGSTVGWTQDSDVRYKSHIKELDAARTVAFVRDLKPVQFRVLKDESICAAGFIAQDVERATKDIGVEFQPYDIDGDGMYGLRYSQFHAVAVKALQVALDRIDVLEKRIDALEQKQKKPPTVARKKTKC